jgi:GNAT superfamily N-acetyltransferase
MPAVTIRPLAGADRAGWDPLWAGYLAYYKENLPPHVTEETWRRLNDPATDPHGIVTVDADGRLIGFSHYLFHRSTWAIGPYCYLEDLFVAPDVRGGGVGKALVEATYAAADAAGAATTYWLTEHYNAAGRRLYDHVGKLSPFIRYQRP